MSRQFKNPFKFDSNTRFSGFSSGTVKPGADSPFVLDFKTRAKPIHSNQELPVFSVEGGWGADNKWQNTGVTFNLKDEKSFNPIKRVKVVRGDKVGWGLKKQEPVGVHLEREHWDEQGNMLDSTYVYMNKDTLKKGTQTILGMNEQVDQDGYLVRGNNYANVWYPTDKKIKADKKARDLREILKKLGPAAREAAEAMETTEENERTKSGFKKRPVDKGGQTYFAGGSSKNADGSYSGGAKAKGAARAKKMKAFEQNYIYQPGVQQANALLADWGRGPVKPVHSRIGYGNRIRSHLSLDPEAFIEKYYETEGLIDWAKGINPEHAKLDPERTVSVVDVASSKQVANVWCHNNNCRTTGYRTVNTSTYKDVLISTRPKYIQMDALYGKIIDKSREKKVKYSGYYDVDPDVEVYNYYGISDDAFESYEGYKQNLLSTIGGRRANQEEIIKQLELDSSTIDKKDRTKNKIPTLEKTNETLDTHATELKDKIDDYDWQGKIAQESFGSDTITGDSHVGHVLQSYGGEVRGDSYYSQDVGKLIRKTKRYERQLEQQIEDKSKEVEGIKLDKTESLVEFYNDKSNKEYGEASQEYLEKSLALTQKEREELEKARKSHAWGTNAPAPSAGRGGRGSRGRPSLRDKSRGDRRRRYRNRRTRGGQDTDELGGIV